MSDLISDEAVCRTAPATPGLFKIVASSAVVLQNWHRVPTLVGRHVSSFKDHLEKWCIQSSSCTLAAASCIIRPSCEECFSQCIGMYVLELWLDIRDVY